MTSGLRGVEQASYVSSRTAAHVGVRRPASHDECAAGAQDGTPPGPRLRLAWEDEPIAVDDPRPSARTADPQRAVQAAAQSDVAAFSCPILASEIER